MYGLNLELEKLHAKEEDWVFGALSIPCISEIPLEDRDKYLPVGERQNIGDEKMDCATRGVINILETKFTFLFQNDKLKNKQWLIDNGYVNNNRIEFSDRYIAIKSGTTRQGNSMKAPVDTVRNGLIPKKMFPQVESFDEYYSGITPEMEKLAKEFSLRFTINYEKVFNIHFGDLLNQDILNVAGYAWLQPINGEYGKTGIRPNHVFILYKLPRFFAFDNYIDFDGDFIKKLTPDYDFMDYGYRLFITKEVSEDEIKRQWIDIVLQWLEVAKNWLVNKQTTTEQKPVVDEIKPKIEPSTSLLEPFCEAIKYFECYKQGSRSYRNCNPGNLKSTPYTQSLGAIGKDKDNFCIFKDYDSGFNALKQFVTDASKNLLKDYKNCTIQTFFNSYSNNSVNYAKYVANKIGKTIDSKLKDFI